MANGRPMGNRQLTPQQAEQVGPSGSVVQDVGAGLTNFGFNMIGSAFSKRYRDPALAGAFQQMGSNINATLRDRFFQKDFEQFQNTYLGSYREATSQLMSEIGGQMEALNQGKILNPDGTVTEIDPTSETAVRMRKSAQSKAWKGLMNLDDELIQGASNYSNNPIVQQTMQNFIQSRTEMIDRQFDAGAVVAGEQAFADVDLARAQATKARADARAAGKAAGKTAKDATDPMGMFTRLGPEGFMAHIVGSKAGREKMEPFVSTARASVASQLMAADQTGSLQHLGMESPQMEVLLDQNAELINKRAAGMYVQSVIGPGAAEVLKGNPKFEGYFPPDAPEKPPVQVEIPGRVEKSQRISYINQYKKRLREVLDNILIEQSFDSGSSAIQAALKQVEKTISAATANNKNAKTERDRIIRALRKFAEDESNFADIPRYAETFAGGERSLLSAGAEVVGRLQPAGLLFTGAQKAAKKLSPEDLNVPGLIRRTARGLGN